MMVVVIINDEQEEEEGEEEEEEDGDEEDESNGQWLLAVSHHCVTCGILSSHPSPSCLKMRKGHFSHFQQF